MCRLPRMRMHALTDLANGYCIRCWGNWRRESIDDRLPPTKSTNPIPESDPDLEPVHKKKKTSTNSKKQTKKKKKNEEMEVEKNQGDVEEAPIAEAKKKKKTETEALQREPDGENESAETDKEKPAELKIGQVTSARLLGSRR